MNLPLKPHWAARLAQIEAELQQLQRMPAVVQHLRASQERQCLMSNLLEDEGHKVDDFINARFEPSTDGGMLVLDERPKPANPAATKEEN